MDKREQISRFARDGAERLELARVLDRMEQSRSRCIPTATHFLTPALQAACRPLLAACGHPPHLWFGGYPDAERSLCIFLPDWLEEAQWLEQADETLGAVEASFPPGATLSHRDILGGLMGLGLTRERLGDILMGEGKAQIIALREVVPILLSQFEQAGRHRLRLREISLSELTPAPASVRRIRDTVATLRLDAVLAAGFSLSRGRAAELIAGGRVSVNHRECTKCDHSVAQGDVLTCRGLGKCVLSAVGGQSRKGRTILELERYQT